MIEQATEGGRELRKFQALCRGEAMNAQGRFMIMGRSGKITEVPTPWVSLYYYDRKEVEETIDVEQFQWCIW